jgi:hypothetical protein
LLFEAQVLLIQLESPSENHSDIKLLVLGDVFQPESEHLSCPLVFLVLYLELSKLDEILFL